MAKHEITRADIMAMDEYATVRDARRKALTELKRHRRVAVGPDVTFWQIIGQPGSGVRSLFAGQRY